MVMKCPMFGCRNIRDYEKELQYYRIPAVIKNHGAECEKLSGDKRGCCWLTLAEALKARTWTNVLVCSAHFVGQVVRIF